MNYNQFATAHHLDWTMWTTWADFGAYIWLGLGKSLGVILLIMAFIGLCYWGGKAVAAVWCLLFGRKEPEPKRYDELEGLPSGLHIHAMEAGVDCFDFLREVSRLIEENCRDNPEMTCGEVVQQAKDNLRNKES